MSENNEICDWLIIFFLHELDGFLEPSTIIEEIEAVGTSEKSLFFLMHDQLQDTGFKTELKWLVKKTTKPDKFKFEIFSEQINFQFHDGRSWESLFKKLFETFKSRKKMIITFSHGFAFGFGDGRISRNEIRNINKRFVRQELWNIQNFNTKKPSYQYDDDSDIKYELADYIQIPDKNIGYDCKDLEILWIAELNEALSKCLLAKKIDILMMINCNMHVLDSNWQLRKNVRYYAACESFVHGLGYSYKDLFGFIKANPRRSARTVSKKIRLHYTPNIGDELEKVAFDNTAMFVQNLKYFNHLKRILDYIILKLNYAEPENIRFIRGLRDEKIKEVSVIKMLQGNPVPAPRFELIDLNNFLNGISKLKPYRWNIKIRLAALLFKFLLNLSILKSQIGASLKIRDKQNKAKCKHSGVGIFFPNNSSEMSTQDIGKCAYLSEQFNPFLKDSKWDEFLRFYMRKFSETKSSCVS